MPLVRTTGVLPEELENIVTQTIGACIAVHRRLGPGLSETIYQRALMVELKFHGLAAEFEKPVPVHYRGELLCNQRIDLVVEDGLIVEVKSMQSVQGAPCSGLQHHGFHPCRTFKLSRTPAAVDC